MDFVHYQFAHRPDANACQKDLTNNGITADFVECYDDDDNKVFAIHAWWHDYAEYNRITAIVEPHLKQERIRQYRERRS